METTRIIHPDLQTPAAVIVGIQKPLQEEEQIRDELNELEQLLLTLGIATKGFIVQKQRHKLSPSILIGIGKVEEICRLVNEQKVGLVVFDHPLSGPQVRNLEKITNCQVLDRSGVILDIFAKHAKSNHAKTQVEIAQLEYLLPRLTGAWSHFQRQTGGVNARGMGEKQIEIDRRRARERISRLHKKLEQIDKERVTQRKKRQNELKVALVGYTNCGKTTVMKGLTRSMIDGKNELFATLDASIRVIDPTTRPKILLSDTVGFVRNLPHSLVESFKSTLDEVCNADLLLHVVDISSAHYQLQIETTLEVLKEIGAAQIPSILVFNKADQCKEQFLAKILQRRYGNSLMISALHPEDVIRLREHIFSYFLNQFQFVEVAVPLDDHKSISLVHQSCVILEEDYEKAGFACFKLRVPKQFVHAVERFSMTPLLQESKT